MDAVKYIKEINRAKKNMEEWESLHIAENENPEKAVEIVEQWAKDHPRKTYRDDFFEKFPDAPKDTRGYPIVLWRELYSHGTTKNAFAQGNRSIWDKGIE